MDYITLYANFLKRFLNSQSKLKAVFDCSNGAAGPILKKLFKGQSNIKAFFINDKPDGRFPAHGPNPLLRGAKKQLESAVLKRKADLGIIFDVDGDRVFFIDNKSRPVDTDIVVYLLAPLFKPPYMVDTAEGVLPLHWLDPHLKVIETKTGHYFIERAMRAKKIDFAAEHSGHYYFKDFYYADSGILAAVFIINQVSALKKKGLDFSCWISSLPKHYESGEHNLKLGSQKRKKFLAAIKQHFKERGYRVFEKDGVTIVGHDFWLNARPSNTEPLLRIQFEAKNKKVLRDSRKAIQLLLKDL